MITQHTLKELGAKALPDQRLMTGPFRSTHSMVSSGWSGSFIRAHETVTDPPSTDNAPYLTVFDVSS
jgi:hypothetical protein